MLDDVSENGLYARVTAVTLGIGKVCTMYRVVRLNCYNIHSGTVPAARMALKTKERPKRNKSSVHDRTHSNLGIQGIVNKTCYTLATL